MNKITKEMEDRLFQNNIIVSDNGENQEAVYITLLGKFGVKIADEASFNLLNPEVLNVFERAFREPLGEPFYRGFPESVKNLSEDEIIIDRLLHYMQTYGAGDFENRHFSIFEKEVERIPFKEKYDLKIFKVVSSERAYKELCNIADTLLMRRQIMPCDYRFVMEMMDNGYSPENIRSKQIMCFLIRYIRDYKGDKEAITFIDKFRAFQLNDILKLIGWDNASKDFRSRPNFNKLNMANKDRKFYATLIEHVATRTKVEDLTEVVEKRKIWKGLLHHIHFKPTTGYATVFANTVFNDYIKSVYSEVEKLFVEKKIVAAAALLANNKGSTAVMRSINRFLCAANSQEERLEIVKIALADANPIAAMQTAISYLAPDVKGFDHTFIYNYYGRTITHKDKRENRPTLEKSESILLSAQIRESLRFKNTNKKIYIDPKAANYAMPIWADEINGVGVMPTGSRIDIPESKVVRAFVYWESEPDLDLSAIAISRENGIKEFSWRSGQHADEGIVFSGDVTDGVYGGAEYFDIDFDIVNEKYKDFDYIIFNVNNFSDYYNGFDRFVSRAGFMTRDKIGSGEIFEPKTVKSAFDLTVKSRQATMFALDLKNRQMVWINKAPEAGACAGDSDITVYLKYVDVTKLFNLKWFFENIAGSITTDPSEADIIVSDDVSLDVEGKTFVNMNNGNAVLKYLITE